VIDPHADDEADYAATLAWEAKVKRARERLNAYLDASAAMGDDADPEDSRRWLQEARKGRSR
jgi:hypothetical protein